MKRAVIKHLGFKQERPEVNIVSELMKQKLPIYSIASTPWEAFPYQPLITFQAGWWEKEICLRYRVNEETSRAKFMNVNDPVCNDSCVEFFIAPGDGTYFNFEFNAAGTCYLGHGRGRGDSRPVKEAAMVVSYPSLGKRPFEEGEKDAWELTVIIPFTIFEGTELAAPGGKEFGSNFYKCGNELKTPHFLSWNPVKSATPDFHRPVDFGRIYFEPQDSFNK